MLCTYTHVTRSTAIPTHKWEATNPLRRCNTHRVLNLTDAASNTFGGFSALTLSGEAFNASNLDDLCVLWGLPYNHPASYARKQCATGYSGNLCAVCISVDGRHYTGPGDFSCNECFDRTIR